MDYVVASPGEPATLSASITEWKKVADVWVPKSLSFRHFQPDGGFTRYTFEYTWESVNKPVDPTYFDYKSFTGTPADDLDIVDDRKEKPVIDGKPAK